MNIDFHSFILGIVKTIEAKDIYTAGHSTRVADISELIAKELNMNEDEIEIVHYAGHLHDIGKIGIPDGILMKTGRLITEEYELIKRHSIIGYSILCEIRGFEKIAKAVRYHHERPDGKGYPDGLKENEIPIEASIIAVADAFDAITSQRTYNASRSNTDALEEIIRLSGTQFSPDVVKAFCRVIEKNNFFSKDL